MRSRITKVGAAVVLAASALAVAAGPARAAGQAPLTKTVQLTGTQLAADLLPAANFPAGYRYDKSTSYDSGPRLETGVAKYHLATISCTTLSKVYGGPGFGETAAAANSYSTLVDNDTATSGAAFAQVIYQFATASAARSFWQGTRSVAVRCPGFGLATHSDHGTERLFKVSIRGTQAFQVDFSASLAPLGTIGGQSLIVVRGQDVFEMDVLGLGRAVPASPSLRTLMTGLLTRVP